MGQRVVKLAARTFKIEWDLHAWFGVVASVGLFVVFYCGIFALFNADLELWQDPTLYTQAADGGEVALSFDALFSKVAETTTVPRGASIALRQPVGRRVASVSVNDEASGLSKDVAIDRVSGQLRGEHSRLADELYSLHFLYQMPYGIVLAGLLAVALFVASISGLVIHWKDLTRQVWQFRPYLRLRFSASDAHKVLGVFGLPFALMFAWSGALLGLWAYLSLPIVHGMFGGDNAAFERAQGYAQGPARAATGQAQPQLPFDRLAQLAEAAASAHFHMPLRAERMYVSQYGDANAWVNVTFPRGGFELGRSIDLSMVTGEVLHAPATTLAPAQSFDMVLYDLHYALFGGYLVKWLYTLLALAVCAVVVTGNLVWLERRDARRRTRGNRILERLTVGSCFGLVFASALYFVVNRLLPGSLHARADIELRVFFASWLVALVLCLTPRWSARRCAAWCCTLSAALFGLTFLCDVFAQRVQLPAPLGQGTTSVLVAQLLVCFLGLSAAAVGRKLAAT
jgi:uncharacterized iron-regulated membrane protein